MHYNPTTTDRSFYRTERDTAYNAAGVAGLEFSVDFKIELGADGAMPDQLLTFRGMWGENTSNKEIMAFQIFVSTEGNINIRNVKNSGEGTVVLDGGIGVGSYVNLKFIFTPAADGTFEARIYVNGETTPLNGKVFKTTYPGTDTFANTNITRVAFKDYGGTRDDDFYFDNLFFGYIKADELP